MALIPDYICNVVNAAFEKAGYCVRTYATDDQLEPDSDRLLEEIDRGDVGILLTASLFGSSAWLDRLATGPVRDRILEKGVLVIIDLCQDASLIRRLPSTYGDGLAAVLSFNDKSFPGMMGGGVLVRDDNGFDCPSLPLGLKWRLYAMLWAKMCFAAERRWCGSRGRPGSLAGGPDAGGMCGGVAFEYSYCREFPYECVPYAATRLQIIMALLGLAGRDAFHQTKESFSRSCPGIRRTPFAGTASFLMCDGDEWKHRYPLRRQKGSYAVHGNPNVSLRPDLVILHNKGFCDE